ncbi:MAG TPA: hypothetical protein VE422_44660 [Terriglobia bacterium]|nr:hypothetical protein [Terriglobia bacterium]
MGKAWLIKNSLAQPRHADGSFARRSFRSSHQSNDDDAMTKEHWLALFKQGPPESQRHSAGLLFNNHHLEHLEVPDKATTSFITSGVAAVISSIP